MRRALCLLMAAAVLSAGGVATAGGVTAARTLPAGTVLRAADLTSQLPEGAGAPGPAAAAMVGLQTRRAIYAGQTVSMTDLGPPTLVERNEIVTMRFASGRLGIRAEGRALEPGGLGQRIRVINLASRSTVTAKIAGPGLVEVGR